MSSAYLNWLTKPSTKGVSFGIPWPEGKHQPGQKFALGVGDQQYPLDSRELGYWADGSLKWTSHSVSGLTVGPNDRLSVVAVDAQTVAPAGVDVQDGSSLIVSNQVGLSLTFGRTGSSLFQLRHGEQTYNATLVASIDNESYATAVNSVIVENATFARAVVKVSGTVKSAKATHLPFDLRVYVYAHDSTIKVVHSFVHDLEGSEPLTSLGLRLTVPLADRFYNRHVGLGGADGGYVREYVQGLTGLRFGPSAQHRRDQAAGKPVTLTVDNWEAKTPLETGLLRVPAWDAYRLSQLSSDGFTIQKRTEHGSWVKVIGGGRSDGTAFVGNANGGGLAVGLENFWERYPTQLDLTGLTTGEAAVTLWLYSPLAEPLDTRPYHDGLGMDTFAKQLEGLDVTYEDFEPGFATANGIARTNTFLVVPYAAVPSNTELYGFAEQVRDPARLVPTSTYMHTTDVFHGYWAPDAAQEGREAAPREKELETNLATLFSFYQGQVEQNRWYGFWDHGDVQHTYDPIRHSWRYDVGGFAWDNSELSTDLWLWQYFLHTGRADVFRLAEAMTQHTGEVDVYHSGRFRGFGTRHGVQHFSDSSKQLRISNPLYRRIYYFLSGGDERIGDLITELQNCQNSLLTLDSHRKVQARDEVPEGFAMTNIGLDCGPLAATWLTAWERRSDGWDRSRDLLVRLLEGLASLPHGIATNAVLLNPATGEIRTCSPPTPEYAISHLSMLFGFPEIFAEVLHYARAAFPQAVASFTSTYLSYCRAYNGGPEVQRREYGFEFPSHAIWYQSHSTLTAFAAVHDQDKALASEVWTQFFGTDGYRGDHDWTIKQTAPPEYFSEGQEAEWITTNRAARYGVAALSNLATVGKYL